MKYLIPLLFLAGCGMDHHVHVDPITVWHRMGIDPDALAAWYADLCQTAPDPTLCKQTKLKEWYAAAAAASVEVIK